jgi:hypothetical protein
MTIRCETPVALFIYNRPGLTSETMSAIRQVKPQKMLIVADGPKPGDQADDDLCRAARDAAKPDWPCEVSTNFAEHNLGCRRRMSSGIDWVFGSHEEAIILEDDCVPSPDFFHFCTELLERYRDEPRVAAIAGTSYADRRTPGPSYYFSAIPAIWGWASWRRAWAHYDLEAKAWLQLRETRWIEELLPPAMAEFWRREFDSVAIQGANSWALQWIFACLSSGGLCANPFDNLVTNTGWDASATHTRAADSALGHQPHRSLRLPLVHPPRVEADAKTELRVFERVCLWYGHTPGVWTRCRLSLNHRLRQLVNLVRRSRRWGAGEGPTA